MVIILIVWKQSTFFNPRSRKHPSLTLSVRPGWVCDGSYWSVALGTMLFCPLDHTSTPHVFTRYRRPTPSLPLTPSPPLTQILELRILSLGRFMIKLCYPPPPPPPAGLIQRAIIASNTNTDWPSFDKMPLMRGKLWL